MSMLKKVALMLVGLIIGTSLVNSASADTISQLNPWVASSGYVKVASTTAGVQIPSLGAIGSPCVVVGITGKLSTSPCGGSGAQTPWAQDINGGGFTLSNAYLTATATTLDLSGVTNSLVYANGIGRLGAIATTSLGLPTFSDLSSYLTLASWYATTTDGLDEGLTNLYFTNPRVQTYLDTLSRGYFWSTTSADAWYATLPPAPGGSGVGTISTSSSETASEIPFYSTTNGYPALLSTEAGFTYTTGGASLLNVPNITVGTEFRGNSIRDLSGAVGFDISDTNISALLGMGGYFSIKDNAIGFGAYINPSNLTDNRTYYFPDQGGTFALDNDLANYVPYIGASGSVDLGANHLQASGIWDSTGRDAITLSDPTLLKLYQPYPGYIQLYSGADGNYANLDTHSLTGNWTYTMPDKNGTIAMLSDISGATASSTLLADFNLFSGDNTFSATSTIPKIFGSAGYQIDPLGYLTNDYSLLIYGGEASSTVAGGSKHGNSIQISGGFPEGMQEDVDGNWWSPNCTIGDGCRGGVVNIYGGFGIEHDGGGLYMYGGDASSTNPNSGGGIQIGGGSGYNAAHGGYLDMQGGQAFGTGDGGYFDISGGRAETGAGGFSRVGGGFSTFGSGGGLTLSGGEGGSSGGEVLIKGGITNISGNAGSIILRGGEAFGSGIVGGVVIQTSTLSNVVEFATTTTGTNYFYNPLSVLSTASSTFANGIDIASGCFSINGVCVGGGSSSAVGGSGAIQFANGTAFNGDNTTLTWDSTNKRLGIGTSTPYATLSVQGKFGGTDDLFVFSTTTSSTGESFKLMSMAMDGKVYIHEKKATTTKSYTLNDPTSIPSITAANYGAYFSDDLTRVLECGTAAASNIQLRNGGFANASQQYVGTTAQTITWTKLYNSVVVGRGCITYGGYHYVLYASTTNAASTAIRRSIAADWNNIAADSNWATATISGVALPTTAFLVGAEGGNIYIASTTNAVQKYIIATSTNTLTSSTYIPLSGANVLINNTRVNNNGIYVGFSSAPFTRKYTLSGTAVSGVTNIGAAVPNTTGPDMFVTESSLYGLYGNSTTLLTRIIGY